MDTYRLTKQDLWDILELWDPYMPCPVRLVACGGTALTLQDLKASTKDVDFLVPDQDEYKALLQTIQKLNYRQTRGISGWAKDDGFIFDLFKGKVVFLTELLDSPLDEGMHIPIKEFKKLSVSALNDNDLIISKMFRGNGVDIEDCKILIRGRKRFDLEKLKVRYEETAKYDLQPEKMMRNLEDLLEALKED